MKLDELIDKSEKRLLQLHKRRSELDGEIKRMADELEAFLAKTDELVGGSKKG